MDIYDTYNMLTAVEVLKPARRFLLDTFFPSVQTSAAKSIIVDIVKGRRKMAPYVSPRVAGKVMQKRGFKTVGYEPAYVKPKTVTTASDFLKRSAGEAIYGSTMTPQDRAALKLAEELMYLDDIITRRLEQMCSEAIQTGKLIIKGDDIEDEVDFMMDPDNLPVFSGTSLFSAKSTAQPLATLRSLKKQALNKSGINPTHCIMATDVYEAFLMTDEIRGSTNQRSIFDMTKINMGVIEPKMLPGGVTYVGTLTETQLDLYTYDEWYIDENYETEQSDGEMAMIKSGNLILGSTNGQGTQYFGAIEDVAAIESGMYAVPRYPKTWIEEDPSVRMLMLQSAPLIVPKVIDSWICAKVL